MRAALRGRIAFLVGVLVVLYGLLGASASWGQSSRADTVRSASPLSDPRAGPLPQHYVGAETYDAHQQNWDATQDTSGTFYVANTDGVLVYDGHSWRTILPANRSIVRSVAADDRGRVFVGAQRDFGVLRRNSTGRRHYTSLLDYVPDAHQSFTDVWRTEVTAEGVYFHTYRRLFRWRPEGNSMQSWALPEGKEFNQGGAANGTFYVGAEGRGLMAVKNDSLHLVPGGEVFADRTVIFVRSHPRHGLVVGTFDGLFVRRRTTFRRLETDVPETIRSAWIQQGTVLPGGTIALATIDLGLLLLGPDGTLRRRLTPRDAPVPGVYADREGGLWALLDGGLMRYDLGAPYTEYGPDVGLDGGVTDVARHGGDLYVSTLQNLFRRQVSADTLAMVPEPDVNTQSWALLSVEEDLLIGTVRGLNRKGPDGAVQRLFDANHVYALLRSRVDSSRVYAATGRGVRIVRRTDAGWRSGPRVPDLDTEARTLAEADDGTLWVGTTFDGVYRVHVDEPIDSTTVDHFGTDHGLPPDRVDPQRWNGEVVIGTSTGLMDVEASPSPTFEPISTVEMPPLRPNEGVARLHILDREEAWGFTGWGPGRWVRRGTMWRWAPGPLHRLRGRSVSVLHSENEGQRLWMGTQKGLVRYVPDAPRAGPPPPVRVQEVHVVGTDSLLPIRRAAHHQSTLSYDDNGVRVAYGTPSLVQPTAVEYQYRVPNRSNDWSSWTGRTERELANLSPGTYTFSVRARTAYGDTTGAARYVFTVLPPWYRTWWAFVLYGLVAVGLVGGTVQWRTRRLRRRQARLEETVAERTEEVRRKNDELARQAEKLKDLDDAKSRFFANLSHEFRTPLTLIQGPVRDVRKQLVHTDGDLETEADQLKIAERNIDRLRRLVDQLLGLARMDAGTYELAARPIDIDGEVRRIVRAFTPLADRHDLTFTVKGDRTVAPVDESGAADVAPVFLDREALEHILGNLLSNAIKFTPDGGRVGVTVAEEADHAAVEVADTGPGIPAAKQDVVFDRFQQAPEHSAGDREGVGIGLAFAKDLVDLHGGTISLDSGEGEGTTVTVRFPRGTAHLSDNQFTDDVDAAPTADEPPDESASSSAPPSPNDSRPPSLASRSSNLAPSAPEGATAPSGISTPDDHSQGDTRTSSRASATDDAKRTKVVLVVDDNADVRRYVRSILEPTFVVIEAADGSEGLTRARDAPPDCILADVMMPKLDGLEMVRHLKDDPATDCIPVVLLTARAGVEHEVEGLEAGADDYVTKPFDEYVLMARVAGMIQVRQRLRRRIRRELRYRRGDRHSEGGASTDRAVGDRSPDVPPPQLVVPTGSDDEPEFIRKVRSAIEDHLADSELDVEQLASEVAVSRSTLYRRLTDEIDQTPSQFIRQVRIEHGARLLREAEGTISEVAYAVGFGSLSYFSRQFREHLGQSPSEYIDAVR